MKKRILILMMLMLVIPSMALAVNSVTTQKLDDVGIGSPTRTITLTTTMATPGTYSDTVITQANILSEVMGWYLYEVAAFPTSGGTAPDAADVFILDGNGRDMLGSVDNGTTAYNGANLIHATLFYSCVPDIYSVGGGHQALFVPVTGPLTLRIANQGTALANITFILTFVKP